MGNVGETPGEIEQITDEHTRSELREVVSELGALQAQVAEWSELHHLLHEIWTAFSLFRVQLAPPGEKGFGADERQAILQDWRLCQARLDALADFGGEIEHIGAPLRREGRELRGERWVVEIVALQLLFEDALKEDVLDPASLFELAQEFNSACHRHLAAANRRLRATVDKFQRLSTHLLGGVI
ncbi:MAG: hypothetical protein KKC18_12340 [Chloroflexi bacterium]|nr:hypothetical protein [Chloroflexota bacterium]